MPPAGVRHPAVLLAVLVALAAGCGSDGPGTAASEGPPSLGMLRAVPDDDYGAFVSELRARGWTQGADVRLLPSDPDTIYPDLEEARQALNGWVRSGVDVLVVFSTPFARLVAEEAPGTPGLFLVNDPVAAGFVDDLDHPDGSLTGVTFRTPADRTLDLADRATGGMERVGYLWPTDDAGVPGHRTAVEAAAEEFGVGFADASFADPGDVPDAVAELADAGVEVVFLASSTATIHALDAIEAELDARRLPAVANTDFAEFAVVVLTPDGAEVRRQLARQAARLLAGTPISAVPVEDPRKFLVIVNRTKVAELGLPPVPDDLLRQADVVR